MRTPTSSPATDRPARMLAALEEAHSDALQGGLMPRKEKAIIALAVAMGLGCEPCVAYHLHNALEAGATEGEVAEAVAVAVAVLSEPGVVHGHRILRALADAPQDAPAMPHAAAHPYMDPD